MSPIQREPTSIGRVELFADYVRLKSDGPTINHVSPIPDASNSQLYHFVALAIATQCWL